MTISKKQLDDLRIVYAIWVACRYHNLKPEVLFEDGLNPEWIRIFDVVNKTPKDFIKTSPKTAEEMRWHHRGFLKFRKTKKGAIVYIDLLRLKDK